MPHFSHALLSPMGLFIILLVIGVVARNIRRVILTLACAVIVFFSLPVIAGSLILSLESRNPYYPIADLPEAKLAILLGGGLNELDSVFPRSELGSSGDRLALAAELYKKNKIRKLLIAGGAKNGNPSEAQQSAGLLKSWGLPDEVFILEEKSTNTVENAKFSNQLLNRSQNETVLLITSAVHMPRARAIFCSQGIQVFGVPANHWVREISYTNWRNWIPNSSSLNGSTRALKEYAGILYYAFRGRLSLNEINHDQSCTLNHA